MSKARNSNPAPHVSFRRSLLLVRSLALPLTHFPTPNLSVPPPLVSKQCALSPLCLAIVCNVLQFAAVCCSLLHCNTIHFASTQCLKCVPLQNKPFLPHVYLSFVFSMPLHRLSCHFFSFFHYYLPLGSLEFLSAEYSGYLYNFIECSNDFRTQNRIFLRVCVCARVCICMCACMKFAP